MAAKASQKPWEDLLERLKERLPPGPFRKRSPEPREDGEEETGTPRITRVSIRTGYDAVFDTDAWEFSIKVKQHADRVKSAHVQVFIIGLGENPVESWPLKRVEADGELWQLRVYENNPAEVMPQMTSHNLDADAPYHFEFSFYIQDLDGNIDTRRYE